MRRLQTQGALGLHHYGIDIPAPVDSDRLLCHIDNVCTLLYVCLLPNGKFRRYTFESGLTLQCKIKHINPFCVVLCLTALFLFFLRPKAFASFLQPSPCISRKARIRLLALGWSIASSVMTKTFHSASTVEFFIFRTLPTIAVPLAACAPRPLREPQSCPLSALRRGVAEQSTSDSGGA